MLNTRKWIKGLELTIRPRLFSGKKLSLKICLKHAREKCYCQADYLLAFACPFVFFFLITYPFHTMYAMFMSTE